MRSPPGLLASQTHVLLGSHGGVEQPPALAAAGAGGAFSFAAAFQSFLRLMSNHFRSGRISKRRTVFFVLTKAQGDQRNGDQRRHQRV